MKFMMLHLYIFFLHGQVNEFYYHFRFVVVQFFFISFSLCGKRWRIRKGACIFCVSAFAEAAILHSLSKSIPFSSLLLFSYFFSRPWRRNSASKRVRLLLSEISNRVWPYQHFSNDATSEVAFEFSFLGLECAPKDLSWVWPTLAQRIRLRRNRSRF